MSGFLEPFPTLASASLTGSEYVMLDTEYAGGVPPQTVKTLVSGLLTGVFGGTVGAATATGTTTATATLNNKRGTITSAALTTAAAGAASWVLTLTNSTVTAASIVLATVGNGTNSAGNAAICLVTPSAGSVIINVLNVASAGSLNGTIEINFIVIN